MPALLARLNCEGGLPVAEYLRREETLFVEPEWTWTCEQKAAHRFPTREAAEAAIADHAWVTKEGARGLTWVLTTEDGPSRETLARREQRLDQMLASVAETEPVKAAEAEPKGVAPDVRKTGSASDRKKTEKRNRRVAGARKLQREEAADAAVESSVNPRGAGAWRQVYHARVSPEETFEHLEQRGLA